MLRSIKSTVFFGTILLAGAVAAQPSKPAAQPSKPASDDKLIESGKPGNPPANIPVPAETAAPEAAAAPVFVPAPPPIAPAMEPELASDAPKGQKKRSVDSAGLNTQATTIGGVADVGDSTSEKDWGFKFKGFFRAPMRLGIDASGSLTPGQLQFHAPPVTPDGNYTRWAYTNISPGPWAELLFQYGNQRVMMTTSIASYNITSGGWRELQDQLGIDRAFLTMKFPEALGDFGGVALDVGIFSNRYGAMGKYDAGQYETYLMGRTRMAGATVTMDLDLGDDFKFIFENGFGAKVDQQYQRYTTGTNTPTYDYPSWQPYPGQATQQGTNMILHDHLGVVIKGIWTIQAHHILSFVKDARWNVGTTGGDPPANSSKPSYANAPGTGYIDITGVDVKLDGGWMGDGYAGFSILKAKNALTINDSIEVLHSQGGWQLAQNYFPDGNGTIYSAAVQYTFSLAAVMMRPRPFWGQAADLTIRPFAMLNMVKNTTGGANDVNKLKEGIDIVYSFIPNLAAGLRFDSVNPNMSNSTQTFYVISPKLIFRSEFVTHEAVVLQYSYYQYGSSYTDPTKSSAVMPWPYGTYGTLNIGSTGLNTQPDKHVVTLYANMWW